MIQKNHVLLGSAAALMLLAGCGNGPDVTSPSGQQSTKAPDSQLTTTAQQSGQGDATQTNAQGHVVTKAPAVAPDSISAELLATLLVGNTNQAGGLFAELSTGAFPHGRLDHAPKIPAMRTSQQARRDVRASGRLYIRAELFTRSTDQEYTFQPSGVGGAFFAIPIAVFEADEPVSREPFGFSGMENKPAGTELLHLFSEIIISIPGLDKGATLKAPDDKRYVLRKGERVPLNTVLKRWVGDNGVSAELMALRGSKEGEIRTCFNAKTAQSSRMVCSVWQLPADWTFPTGVGNYGSRRIPYGGYVVNENLQTPKGQQSFYWQSRYLASRQPALPSSRRTAPINEPINKFGVSGDVFASMLVQSEALIGTQAQPASGPVPYGQLLAQADKPNITATPYGGGLGLFGNQDSHFIRTQLSADDSNFNYIPLRVHIGSTLRHQTEDSDGKPSFDASIPSGSELLNLTHNIRLTWKALGTPAGGSEQSLMLHPTRAFSVHKDRIVRFDFRQHRWQTRDRQYVDLMLLRGIRPDQARLCTHVQLKAVKRLQCADWQVPAGWTLGQPLKPLGVSVVDTRSVYPGETGYHYWMTAAMSK